MSSRLSRVNSTTDSSQFFKVRFSCDDDQLLGHLKAHV